MVPDPKRRIRIMVKPRIHYINKFRPSRNKGSHSKNWVRPVSSLRHSARRSTFCGTLVTKYEFSCNSSKVKVCFFLDEKMK
jgi:hypothetical protein